MQQPSRIPQNGEALILNDGRRFVVTSAENGQRGWWFMATEVDGHSTLQGNLRIEWDPQGRAWRPASGRSQALPLPVSPRKVRERSRHAD